MSLKNLFIFVRGRIRTYSWRAWASNAYHYTTLTFRLLCFWNLNNLLSYILKKKNLLVELNFFHKNYLFTDKGFEPSTEKFIVYRFIRYFCSSYTFPYSYLVTTSSKLPISQWALARRPSLQAKLILCRWRAVCTRPIYVFTATFWFAITSDSDFMQTSFSLQSELGKFLKFS